MYCARKLQKKILEATLEDVIVVLRFTGHPIRVIKNKWAEEMLKLEEKGAFPEEIKAEMIAGINPATGKN